MEKGNMADLEAACRRMRDGDELYFELKEKPQRGQLALLVATLAESCNGLAHSFLRNGVNVHVSCYVPITSN